MAISKLGGSTSDNWELITSVTPTAASTTVNFLGLSVYKKLKVVFNDLTTTGSLLLRLNNDATAGNYIYTFYRYAATAGTNTTEISVESSFVLNSGSATSNSGKGIVTIESCDNTNLKTLSDASSRNVDGASSEFLRTYYNAIYKGSAVVSQVNLVSSGTFSATGTVALYGVK